MREVVVFSGSAHTALAHRICDELGVTLSETLISRFSKPCRSRAWPADSLCT